MEAGLTPNTVVFALSEPAAGAHLHSVAAAAHLNGPRWRRCVPPLVAAPGSCVADAAPGPTERDGSGMTIRRADHIPTDPDRTGTHDSGVTVGLLTPPGLG